ncbi:MAG: Fructuronate reductase [Xylanivirga thermophila]
MVRENLKKRVAVITGGGGVLCSSFATALTEHGIKIAVLDIDKEKAQDTVEEVKNMGGEAIAIACDVLDRDSVADAEKEISKVFGGYDILINGAGGNHPKGTTTKETLSIDDLNKLTDNNFTFLDMDAKDLSWVFDLNFIGTLIPTQIFLPKLAGKKGATIINISSMSAFCPMTKVPAYSAAKAAISNFTQWLAVYLANAGIRVNAIAPGFFETEQNRTLLRNKDGSLTERSNKIITHTPMRRFGKPEDLHGTLIWLCDEEESGFVTGVVIPVDGGFMAYSGV